LKYCGRQERGERPRAAAVDGIGAFGYDSAVIFDFGYAPWLASFA
jgi:hypothetical protein